MTTNVLAVWGRKTSTSPLMGQEGGEGAPPAALRPTRVPGGPLRGAGHGQDDAGAGGGVPPGPGAGRRPRARGLAPHKPRAGQEPRNPTGGGGILPAHGIHRPPDLLILQMGGGMLGQG